MSSLFFSTGSHAGHAGTEVAALTMQFCNMRDISSLRVIFRSRSRALYFHIL
jgi:hypothetical protein